MAGSSTQPVIFSSVPQGAEKEQEAGQGYEPLKAHPCDFTRKAVAPQVTLPPGDQVFKPMNLWRAFSYPNHHRCFPTDLI